MATRTNTEKVQLTLSIDGKPAENTITGLDEKAGNLLKEMHALEDQGLQATEAYRKLNVQRKELLKQSNQAYEATKKAAEQQARLSVNEGKSLKQLQADYRQLNAIVANLPPTHKDFNANVELLHAKKAKIDEIKASFRGVKEEVDGSGKATGGFLSMLRTGAGAVAAFFAVDKLVQWGRQALGLYDEAARGEAQLQAVLKSTNEVAGRSLAQLKAQQEELQKVTLFDDDATAQAQALLLTFTKVRTEVFDASIPAIQDYATAMATASGETVDLKGATIQVGKALNDPIKGIAALGKAGVQFTKEQKEQIRVMVESGRVADAQRLILKELETQFGGSAKAAAAAGTGGMKQLVNIFNNLLEVGGKILYSVFRPLVPLVMEVVDWLTTMADSLDEFTDNSETAAGSVGRLQQQFNIEIETLQRGNLSAENRKKLIEDINTKYKDYLPNLIKETDNLGDLKAAQDAANVSFQQRITLLATQQVFQDLQEKAVKAGVDALNLQVRLTDAQNQFNAAAERGRAVTGANDRDQRQAVNALDNLNDVKEAVKENAEQQQQLALQLEKVRKAAAAANVELLNQPAGPGGGDDGTGGGGGGDKGEKRKALFDLREKELQAFFERENLFIAGAQLREEITEQEAAARRLDNQRSFYQAQLALLEQFGKQQENKYIEVGNQLEAVRAQQGQAGALLAETMTVESIQTLSLKVLDTKKLEADALLNVQRLQQESSEKSHKDYLARKAANEKAYADGRAALERAIVGVAKEGLDTVIGFLGQDEAARKKNAKALKAFAIGNIWVNYFQEVSSIWETANANPTNILFPGSGNLIAALKIAFASARAQAATSKVAAQKYEFGGIPDGPGHPDGGIKLVSASSGRVVGEMEGGEPILSRATYKNNRPIIDRLLFSSMHRGGAPIFATGGFAPSAPAIAPRAGLDQSGQRAEQLYEAMLMEQVRTRQAIEAMPTTLRADVSLRTIKEADQTLGDIRKAAAV